MTKAVFSHGGPRFALVVGSGGVRSAAALGVAEVLWQERLRPDLIVGCSAGALFGGLLAMGLPPAEAAGVATELWTADLTHQPRRGAVLKMLLPRWFGFDADFSLRDDAPIVRRLERAFGERRLEDLPIPLRVAATDAATGATVVLQSGRLVDALRASIALPFMLAPVQVDGRRLIDGFVSDPLPVAAAADADVALALGFRAQLPSRIDGPSRLLGQFTSAMTNNLMDARLAAAQAAGARLLAWAPGLQRRVGLFETEALPQIVAAGRELAQRELSSLRSLLQAREPLRVAA